mmetsp:Transcript_133662/g.316811  ORF Transcript_133662/g.316811 Transcript_133662/m.316811 type:complete len:395 (-) Transcript_133662:184-1368(-)
MRPAQRRRQGTAELALLVQKQGRQRMLSGLRHQILWVTQPVGVHSAAVRKVAGQRLPEFAHDGGIHIVHHCAHRVDIACGHRSHHGLLHNEEGLVDQSGCLRIRIIWIQTVCLCHSFLHRLQQEILLNQDIRGDQLLHPMQELGVIGQPVIWAVTHWQILDKLRGVLDHLYNAPRHAVNVGVKLLNSLSDHRRLLQDSPNFSHVAVALLREHLGVVFGKLVYDTDALHVCLVQQPTHHHHKVLGPELLFHCLLVLLHNVRDGHEDRGQRLREGRRALIRPLATHRAQLALKVCTGLLSQRPPDELHVLLHSFGGKAEWMEELGEARDPAAVFGGHGGLEAPAHDATELPLCFRQGADGCIVRARRQAILGSSEARNIPRSLLKVFRRDGLHYLI